MADRIALKPIRIPHGLQIAFLSAGFRERERGERDAP